MWTFQICNVELLNGNRSVVIAILPKPLNNMEERKWLHNTLPESLAFNLWLLLWIVTFCSATRPFKNLQEAASESWRCCCYCHSPKDTIKTRRKEVASWYYLWVNDIQCSALKVDTKVSRRVVAFPAKKKVIKKDANWARSACFGEEEGFWLWAGPNNRCKKCVEWVPIVEVWSFLSFLTPTLLSKPTNLMTR